MSVSIYNYKDYKKYLSDMCLKENSNLKGPKARLAEFIGCQLAYLSQVLNGEANLSSEQAEACNRFFGHNKRESIYFLNIVHYVKAGTENLKKFYSDQINEILEEQKLVAKRLNLNKTLTPEIQARYYSSWDYLAVNIAVSVAGFQSQKELSEKLGLSVERLSEVLNFLEENSLVKKEGDQYSIGESGFHLAAGSPFLVKHHTNWRIQAIRSLDDMKTEDLHYSSVISCDQKDIPQIKEALLSAVEKVRKIVRESENVDSLMSYSIDMFPVKR
jgi:uncharacterized protein (TIGR02147 family)